ncbi:Gibberellin 2-beta-dioxygenase 8 [Heracleum sosnowskyi]|uniref:gibberellin 2beta-dioxygenase n=1 Tax=Heracleum sosnowskyi TaxID=360622 RepID=A0AAD8MW89_9APIA|nr:Gibberellin 2-beta-dioxygenase 8 [Heracleum sosnowskyi]
MIHSNINPPLLASYAHLVHCSGEALGDLGPKNEVVMEECELPLIDLSGLRNGNEAEKVACVSAICKASSEWGFFQVVNHGVSLELLRKMRREQKKLFESSFEKKYSCGLLNKSYRWGNQTATTTKQLSWSEAFHVPLDKIFEEACCEEFNSSREVMGRYAGEMQKLARMLARVLVTNMGEEREEVYNICDESTCFLRLNRYPICPIAPEVFGLVPHTDSDFLTILHQDEVGGLQLMKDSKWVAVKPNQDALIVNIGDLFQAWSNDAYRSVEHKVMVNAKVERYSIAYFLCPSSDSVIGSCKEPSVYRKFTFGEYRSQTQQDVKKIGQKVGLPRFLNCDRSLNHSTLSTT